ncbi:hypothetical protein HZS_3261 [Henneguya salminicola]|nr:hypothetical protein HZS_3261 [Henneguya salminicola]
MPKPKICNIFYLLAKLFFSWDINIFLRDISKNTLENLVPLPSKLEVHRINEIHVDKKRNVINIWQNLYRIFRARYLCLGFLFFTSTLLMYGQPLVLEQILKNISELNQDNFWLCIIWMSVSVLCNFLTTLTRTHYDYQISILCLEGKSFLLLKIFDLIIINPSYKLSRFSSGETGFYRLIIKIKLFFLFGVSFCVLLAPINYVIGRKVEIFSKRILSFSDCRIKTLREILAGIVNIRINDWIQPFKNIILTIRCYKFYQLRNQELKYLSKQKYLDALCVTFWAISPSIVAAISLGFYVYFGNVLTPQKDFFNFFQFFK